MTQPLQISMVSFFLVLVLVLLFLLLKRRSVERPSTRREGRLAARLKGVFKSDKKGILEKIEMTLLEADMGPQTVVDIMEELKNNAEGLRDYNLLSKQLASQISRILQGSERRFSPEKGSIILVMGVNGVGKTTTVAKLAHYLISERKMKVSLAAGDTYRAAAVEQLAQWANKLDIKLYSQQAGADPGSVIFDAVRSFQQRGDSDILIVDTGGRIHTNENLINQFTKIQRVIEKAGGKAADERILIIDGTTGQNALNQIDIFKKNSAPTGLIITKMDGTAKGGILVQSFRKFSIPVLFMGTGERFEDLAPFKITAYLEKIF